MAQDSLQRMQASATQVFEWLAQARQLDARGERPAAQAARNKAGRELLGVFGRWMDRFFQRMGVPEDEAQDLTQDAMIKLVTYANDVQGNAFALVCRARRSIFLDYLKRRKAGKRTLNADGQAEAEVQLDEESWDALGERVPDERMPIELVDCVQRKMHQFRHLAPARAEVLELYTAGLSAREIAAVVYDKAEGEISKREEANMRARIYDLKNQAQALFAECQDD